LITWPYIKENGTQKQVKEMEKEFKFGLMVPAMTASGRMEWPKAMDDWFMLKATSMKVPGTLIKQMATEFTPIMEEVVMRDNGSMTNKTVKEARNGQTAQSTSATINKASNMVKANLSGVTSALTTVNSKTIT
jgi:hypothetical protein